MTCMCMGVLGRLLRKRLGECRHYGFGRLAGRGAEARNVNICVEREQAAATLYMHGCAGSFKFPLDLLHTQHCLDDPFVICTVRMTDRPD